MGTAPNPYTSAALGTSATGGFPKHGPDWTLQHRHPDGRHWQIVGYYSTKALAKETAKAFVAAGYGEPDDFRIKRRTVASDV